MTLIAGSGSESGSGSISQRHESADPDPLQNVMDDGSATLLLRGSFVKVSVADPDPLVRCLDPDP